MKTSGIIRSSAVLPLALLAGMAATDVSASLQIYKVKGNVTLRKGKQAVKINRREEVKKTDLLNIPKDGRADVLDTQTRRIYSSKGSGSMTVKALIDKAEEHAAGITSNINRKVIAAVNDQAAEDRKAYEAMGMAIHETDAVIGPPIAIPEGTTYLSYLIAETEDSDRLHRCNTSLRTVPTDPEGNDGAFTFAITNSTTKPLYFNIMEKGIGKGLSLLLPQNSVSAPKEETIVEEYTFIPDEATKGYIAIASESDFSADDLWRLLDPGYEARDNFFLTVLTLE